MGFWGSVFTAVMSIAIMVGFIMAAQGGALGVVESIGQVSHVMSDIRIMAVGLSGANFANAINSMVVKMGAAGIIVGVLLHSLNFVIAAFSPNIHALRLNFLEFSGKFYASAKQQYSPFQKTGGEKSA
jgi:V/A-type H+-transporting ATPase subunit I